MKLVKYLFVAVIALSMNISGSAQTSKKEDSSLIKAAENIEVLYFHYTRRCATCNAVESVTKEALTEFYNKDISFSSYNLDEEEGETKGKELEISGQTLIIVAGETKINITNEGFMYARSNPDKLKQIIKEKIDPIL